MRSVNGGDGGGVDCIVAGVGVSARKEINKTAGTDCIGAGVGVDL